MAGPDRDKEEHPHSPLNPYDKRTQEQIERETERRAQDPIAGRGEYTDVDPAALEAGYELKDVNLRSLARASVALLIFTVIALLATTALLGARTGELNITIEDGVAPNPEGEVPLEIESRRVEGVEYQYWYQTQSTRLNSYGYHDEAHTEVYIPVERAMQLMLEEGAFPARAEGSSDPLVEERGRPLRYSADESYDDIVEELERARTAPMSAHSEDEE